MIQTIFKDFFGFVILGIAGFVNYRAYELSKEFYLSTGCVKAENLIPYLPDDYNVKVLIDTGDSPQNAAQFTMFVLFPVNLLLLFAIVLFSRVVKDDHRTLYWFKTFATILSMCVALGFAATIVIAFAAFLLITLGAILRPNGTKVYIVTCVLLYFSHTNLIKFIGLFLQEYSTWRIKLVIILINYLIVRWHTMLYHLWKTNEINKITFSSYYVNAIQYLFLPYISINGTIVMFGDWLNQKKELLEGLSLPLGYRDIRSAELDKMVKNLVKYLCVFIVWRLTLINVYFSCLSNHFILRNRINSTKFTRLEYFSTELSIDEIIYDNELEKNHHILALFGLVNRTASFFLAYYIIFGLLIWLNDAEDLLVHGHKEVAPRIYPHKPKCIFALNNIGEIWRYFDVGMYNYLTECVYFYFAKRQNDYFGKDKRLQLKPIISTVLVFILVFFYHGNDIFTLKWVAINGFMVIIQRLLMQISKHEHFQSLTESKFFIGLCQALSLLIFQLSSSFFVERSNIAYWLTAMLFTPSGLLFAFWQYSSKMFMQFEFDC